MSDDERFSDVKSSGKRLNKNYDVRFRRNKDFRRFQKDCPVCPYCKNLVRDLNTAIAAEESGEPAHFDCVLKQIESRETLEKDEKISYLGNGKFGITKLHSKNKRFSIRKIIQYESEDKTYDWRKKISNKIKR